MAWLRGSRPVTPAEEPFDPLAAVRSAAKALEEARAARDHAISAARMHRVPLRDIADAAGLGLTRVKQVSSDRYTGATKPGVTEVDLIGVDAIDRVLALDEVAPFLEQYDSERDFIAANEDRRRGRRMDLTFKLYDADDLEVPWVATWLDRTGEIYVHRTHESSGWSESNTVPDWDPAEGSPWGPCIVLGHLPSWEIVEAGIDEALRSVVERPGGLAWMFGRVRRVNRIIRAVGRSDRFDNKFDIFTYLDELDADEKGTI